MTGPLELTGFWSAAGFAARRRFEAAAREFIRLPRAGEGPLEHLRSELVWQELLRQTPEAAGWLMALSAATGVYFFPSREWPPRFLRFLGFLKVRRLLEAGAGRGYLSAALAPLARLAGLTSKAVDNRQGEFQTLLPVSEVVMAGDVFVVAPEFQPEAILYAWPPPGQSLAPLFKTAALRYLFVVGEAGGGVTGAREDWLTLPHKPSRAMRRFGRGRTGPRRHQVTIFWR